VARGGQSCGVSSDLGAGIWDNDDDHKATLEQQQHAGWWSTYIEHALHVSQRAHFPISDGLIEGLGMLQRSEVRTAV